MIWGLFLVFAIFALYFILGLLTLGVGLVVAWPIGAICVLIWIVYYGMVQGKWVFWDNWDTMKVRLTPTPYVMAPLAK